MQETIPYLNAIGTVLLTTFPVTGQQLLLSYHEPSHIAEKRQIDRFSRPRRPEAQQPLRLFEVFETRPPQGF